MNGAWCRLVLKSWGPTNTRAWVRTAQRVEEIKARFKGSGVLVQAASGAGFGWLFQVRKHNPKNWTMTAVVNGRIFSAYRPRGVGRYVVKRYENAARKAGGNGSQQ